MELLEPVLGVVTHPVNGALVNEALPLLHAAPVEGALSEDLGLSLIQREMRLFFGPLLDKSVEGGGFSYHINDNLGF